MKNLNQSSLFKRFTVKVTKCDGMTSNYYVLALSFGGAETAALNEVYQAKYALAEEGWPVCVSTPDLLSDTVKNKIVSDFVQAKGY